MLCVYRCDTTLAPALVQFGSSPPRLLRTKVRRIVLYSLRRIKYHVHVDYRVPPPFRAGGGWGVGGGGWGGGGGGWGGGRGGGGVGGGGGGVGGGAWSFSRVKTTEGQLSCDRLFLSHYRYVWYKTCLTPEVSLPDPAPPAARPAIYDGFMFPSNDPLPPHTHFLTDQRPRSCACFFFIGKSLNASHVLFSKT